MVQREQWDTYWGPKKLIFLIREIDDAAMAGASVESCRFVVLRSLGGRSGSALDVGKRRHRLRGRFHRWPTLSASHRAGAQVPQVWDPELSGEPQALAYAAQATTRPQTYPEGSPRADIHPKKVSNLGPMAPRSRQKRQLP